MCMLKASRRCPAGGEDVTGEKYRYAKQRLMLYLLGQLCLFGRTQLRLGAAVQIENWLEPIQWRLAVLRGEKIGSVFAYAGSSHSHMYRTTDGSQL